MYRPKFFYELLAIGIIFVIVGFILYYSQVAHGSSQEVICALVNNYSGWKEGVNHTYCDVKAGINMTDSEGDQLEWSRNFEHSND
jgi:hypothetical protein